MGTGWASCWAFFGYQPEAAGANSQVAKPFLRQWAACSDTVPPRTNPRSAMAFSTRPASPILLTAGLPDRLLARPAGILAFRLRETPLPVPPRTTHPVERPVPAPTPVTPFQTCDGCERAFRAPEPGRCRDCRSANGLRAAG
jgi:hypothetical protein